MIGNTLRLGILGLSPGNGHPYSWSAIFNGYDATYMDKCPFPVIPEYLSRQDFPEACIPYAEVTHIWTQDIEVSRGVARAANIKTIVNNYEDMIGQVDAILLARDDPASHVEMSLPFLKAGLPIYIDKPIANSLNDLERLFAAEQYEGQIFSCSALRYAKELNISQQELAQLGEIQYIDAVISKDWEKYGIHLLDPIFNLIGYPKEYPVVTSAGTEDKKVVTVAWDKIIIKLSTLGALSVPITIQLYGTKGTCSLVFRDTFFAFKKALEVFVESASAKCQMISHEYLRNIVYIIEQGLK